MKSGVEAGYLGYLGKMLGHPFDRGNLWGQMQRRKTDQGSQLLAERIGYACWSRMIRATVY
jgi:hypothetical protein